MRLHVLPLPDLWVAANAKAYVLPVAANVKMKGVHVLPTSYWVRAAPMYEFSITAGRALDEMGVG